MAVKISRNPLSGRPRAKPWKVVADAQKPDLGAVGVVLCEIPRGLLGDFKDEIDDATAELADLDKQIESARLRVFTEVAAAREKGATEEALDAVRRAARARGRAEVAELKEARREARRRLFQAQVEVVQWGICGHAAADFTDEETGEAYEFRAGRLTYDSVDYKVAHRETVEAYISVGAPFIQALYFAILAWQQGRVTPPAKVWEEAAKALARKRRELAEALRKRLLGDGMPEADVDQVVAELLSGVDEEAGEEDPEAPAEVAGDPLASGATATATPSPTTSQA
jgi:hypothetical protein